MGTAVGRLSQWSSGPQKFRPRLWIFWFQGIILGMCRYLLEYLINQSSLRAQNYIVHRYMIFALLDTLTSILSWNLHMTNFKTISRAVISAIFNGRAKKATGPSFFQNFFLLSSSYLMWGKTYVRSRVSIFRFPEISHFLVFCPLEPTGKKLKSAIS